MTILIKAMLSIFLSVGLGAYIINFEPEVVQIDYHDYQALSYGLKNEQRLAREMMIYAFTLPDVEKQCTDQTFALVEVNAMYFEVNCSTRNKYLNNYNLNEWVL